MGKISQGILGGVSGKVGSVIGASWKGIDYLRIMPSSVSNPKTDPQESQRAKLGLVVRMFRSMAQAMRHTFKRYAVKMSGYNAAISYSILNAISGTYPLQTIAYDLALVARGLLTSALNAAATSAIAHTVAFTWDDNSGSGSATASDKTWIIIYNPRRFQTVYFPNLAIRSAGTQNVTVPDSWSSDQVHCYLAFVKDDDSEFSNSSYAGAITVA